MGISMGNTVSAGIIPATVGRPYSHPNEGEVVEKIDCLLGEKVGPLHRNRLRFP